jgi:hypothetical protein
MATRYSGKVTVDVRWVESIGRSRYRAGVSWPGGRSVQFVGLPGVLTKAVDSPQAYDEAASAAISFASDEGKDVGDYTAYTDRGLWIGRSKAQAWPQEASVARAVRRSPPNRAELIAALGLDPEGSSRQQKYAATTQEFWQRVQHGTAPTDIAARKKLGLSGGGAARVVRGGEVDEHAKHELDLYAESTSELYNQKKSILANIQRRHKNGTYDPARAPQLWMHWVDAASKRYRKEFGGSPEMFNKATRESLAKELADRYRSGQE